MDALNPVRQLTNALLHRGGQVANGVVANATGVVTNVGARVGQYGVDQTLKTLERTGALNRMSDKWIEMLGRIESVQVRFRAGSDAPITAVRGAEKIQP